ncbi:MAG: bifunctional 23S rRNA (guanine(2069)-N(7))-methyltransferase RlmK/23S rRNA (guanine(2445)-N(2))-methyltransferase RlmL, partial [Gammaproteobacteria bacterium]|nr:bifunctional 23S rRNA (guanine(2069)-N(7))-methyltransferase RlmK/23S rRNA (guanine(2445)-N(2))-methyltransferase RlmL [Gammaproteobacteria bacterium]
KGLEDLLINELKSLGIENAKLKRFVIEFEGSLQQAYRVCLYSRLASRVLMPLHTAAASNEDELYAMVQEIQWHQHIEPTATFAVDSVVLSSEMTNSHYAALKVKDAVVDQFVDMYQSRPNVEKQQPDVRLHLYLHQNEATISIDLSGESLHKRGYRVTNVAAPLKENLAAAILLRAGWPETAKSGGTLLDPMCGSATFLVEGALMAAGIAAGVMRDYYGFIGWKGHDSEHWDEIKSRAADDFYRALEENKLPLCYGYDEDEKTVEAAYDNIESMGLSDFIKIRQQKLEDCEPAAYMKAGLVITNPPYGQRLGDTETLRYLYSDLGDILKLKFSDWNASVFSCNEKLLKNIALRAHKTNKFYNGALLCQLNHYHILPLLEEQKPVTIEDISEQALTFKNRLQKNLKHLKKWARKNQISCYRIYDADIPEFAFAIDVYNDWYHVQEYQAPGQIELAKVKKRQLEMQCVVKDVTGDDGSKLVFKTRTRQRGVSQYEKHREDKNFFQVEESGLLFDVNLTDYLDTGLFLDHRMVRQLIRDESQDKRVLNLFAYTGTASVYAAAGNAKSITTVDMSNTYLNWAKRNFKLNNLNNKAFHFVQADCINWLKENRKKYDLIFLDPPTFSNSKRMESTFDIQRDHLFLIKTCMAALEKGGDLIFSNNMKSFKLDHEALIERGFIVKDITKATMPEDFNRPKCIHHCWRITRK